MSIPLNEKDQLLFVIKEENPDIVCLQKQKQLTNVSKNILKKEALCL